MKRNIIKKQLIRVALKNGEVTPADLKRISKAAKATYEYTCTQFRFLKKEGYIIDPALIVTQKAKEYLKKGGED